MNTIDPAVPAASVTAADGITWGIVGGMGPAASAAFVQTVYDACAGRPEQEMPVLLLASDPTFPDRTTALLAGDTQPIVEPLARRIDQLAAMGADRIVVCCMTAHALFVDLPPHSRRRLVSLVDLLLARIITSRRRCLLLCTEGTRRVGLLQRSPLWTEAARYLALPDHDDQARIHRLIYELKLGPPRAGHLATVDDLVARYGADCIAGGCTEIHLLSRFARGRDGSHWARAIDPLAALAEQIAWARPVTSVAAVS
jgi:aspartate racemase